MYQEDNILQAFEESTFLHAYDFKPDIIQQLDDVTQWLNGTFIPAVYTSVRHLDAVTLRQCSQKAKDVKMTVDKMYNYLNAKSVCEVEGYSLKCSKCNATLTQESRLNNMWDVIQSHEHIEEALVNCSSVVVPGDLLNGGADVVEPPALAVAVQDALAGDNYCDNCSSFIAVPTDFKFNFYAVYFPPLKESVFQVNRRSDKLSLDGIDLFTLKMNAKSMVECMVCYHEMNRNVAKQHIKSGWHVKRKLSGWAVKHVAAFHRNWTNEELCFQAHLVYFSPFSNNMQTCRLCDDTRVRYSSVREHILDDCHKQTVLNFFNEQVRVPLIRLQVKVYSNDDDDIQIGGIDCNNCSSPLPNYDAKFNFNIGYSPMLETLLYDNKEKSRGVNSRIMQCRDAVNYRCLLCCCDFSVDSVKMHLQGRSHVKNLSCADKVDKLAAYHRNWVRQEHTHQAHQVFFYPHSSTTTTCHLCDGENVFYELLEHHINFSETHREFVLVQVQHSPLIHLQKSIYQDVRGNESDLNDLIDSIEQAAINEPSTSVNSRLNRNVAENESSDSDVEGSVEEQVEVVEVERNVSNVNKVIQLHEFVKSWPGEGKGELYYLIEHRFWVHFDKVMKIEGNRVCCLSCQVQFQKDHDKIVQHVSTSGHQTTSGIKKKYNYYCEICNTTIKHEDSWMAHFSKERHFDRCENLGASRRNKITEYECKTCRLIIFGDEISIKRHSMTSNKAKSKPKRIVLHKKVKDMFISEERIRREYSKMVDEANELNQSNLSDCCNAIRQTLMEVYPTCRVYPFGSKVSGLGSKTSDLDLFVDLGGMYYGDKNQDSLTQVHFVSSVMKLFRKKPNEFTDLFPIPRARTPIVQLLHIPTKLDCDLSFRHGLSIENTKFLRLCIEVQPSIQGLVLLLKQWLEISKLTNRNITTYALAMMVVFYFQISEFLIPVNELNTLTTAKQIIIDGWGIMDFSSILPDCVRRRSKICNKSMKELLVDFFLYYSKFNFSTDVICPLLGRPIKKSLFVDNLQGVDLPPEMLMYVQKLALNTAEYFRAQTPMCIQDPFDLSHNLTKAASHNVADKFIKMCDLSHKFLTTGK